MEQWMKVNSFLEIPTLDHGSYNANDSYNSGMTFHSLLVP